MLLNSAGICATVICFALIHSIEAPAPSGVPTTVYVSDGATAVTPGLSATTSPAGGTIYCSAILAGADAAQYSVTPNAAGSAVAAATGCTLVRGSNADHSTAATETIDVIVCDAADDACATAVTITVTVLLAPTVASAAYTITNGLTAVTTNVVPSAPAGGSVYCSITGSDITISPTTAGAAVPIATGCSMAAVAATNKANTAQYTVDITVYNALGANPSTTVSTQMITVSSDHFFSTTTFTQTGSCASAAVGDTVVTISPTATSHDGTSLTYTLTGTNNGHFAIANNGAVTVASTPTDASYTLTVNSVPAARNTATLTITMCTTTTITVATTTAPSSATVTKATSVFVVAAVFSLVVLNI